MVTSSVSTSFTELWGMAIYIFCCANCSLLPDMGVTWCSVLPIFMEQAQSMAPSTAHIMTKGKRLHFMGVILAVSAYSDIFESP
jgi:hypothetical protein